MGRVRRTLGRPWFIAVLVTGVVLVGAGLYWFQPWKLWVDETVRDPLPVAEAGGSAQAPPEDLARGQLISHEHETSGSVRILRLADGTRVLRITDLSTSNGPALKVWLTDAEVKPGKDGWHVFDDGRHISLGALKGNKGDQNYALPAGADLNRYRSVTIWCDRFDVSFGATELTRV
ncbi:DM13 domain-containing protein [Streptomyces sp. AN091965]|uniref:DM13 domain-containing protein n=1 Tax=Streptomyces sp. AN091965 TaxID=2927803 RepID=UPI001F625B67|nr:DM13 domain-containing protein [Streptomyces sp. AN091965]MCI3928142.1 DM13 domain-containing protein [Streptomyces sp. AN091965]